MALTPQDPNQMAASVDRIAANRMGVPAAEQPAAPAPVAPEPPAPKDTDQDKAAAKAAPVTEDDKAVQEPLEYTVAVKVNDKDYTQKQVEDTFARYSKLNHRNALLKPIHNVIENYLSSNPNESVDSIAQKLQTLAAGGQSEPTFGGQGPQANNIPDPSSATASPPAGESNEAVSAARKEWLDKNALDSLPPGLEALLSERSVVGDMGGRMNQIEDVLSKIMPMLQGGMDAVRGQTENVNNQADANRQMMIATNIDRAQQAFNIPDDQAPQFETWIQMMGLTLSDFLDAEDAQRYMSEFDRHIKGGKYDDLKAMTEKRLAFTGSLGSTPSTPTPQASAEEGRFNALSDKIMAQKGLA